MTATPKGAALVGLAAGTVLVVVGIVAPTVAAAGWLIAFTTMAAVGCGSLALLLIHRLTGGRWGDLVRPALVTASGLVPLLLVGFLVLLAAARLLYPWVRDNAAPGPGVASAYLNVGFFAVRSLVFLAGFGTIAIAIRYTRFGRLAAGLGLVWYGVGMNFVAVDWLSSVAPRYTSSAFGAQIIVAQLVAALASAILASHDRADVAWPDLAALLLAVLLGESYLLLMTFIVHWYGDQPQQAAWYLLRSKGPWVWIETLGVLIGAIGPLIALLFAGVRRSPSALKGISAAALLGVFLENAWLAAPQSGGWALAAGFLAVLAIGGVALGIRGLLPHPTQKASHGI